MDENTLKQRITEAVQSALEEADYPADFDFAAFKKLPSFAARLKYVKARLPKVAQGSSRAVFVADPNTVIKVAMNPKGIAQNETEADIGRFADSYPVAKVLDVGDHGIWLEMERAVKATPKVFAQLAGMTLKKFETIFRYYGSVKRGRSVYSKPARYDELMDGNEFLQRVQALIDDYDMPPGDVVRISSWGIVTREGNQTLVLIDFGLTNTVYNDFYA